LRHARDADTLLERHRPILILRIFVFMSRLHATLLAAGHRARVDDVCVQPGPFPPPVVSWGYDAIGAQPPPPPPALG